MKVLNLASADSGADPTFNSANHSSLPHSNGNISSKEKDYSLYSKKFHLNQTYTNRDTDRNQYVVGLLSSAEFYSELISGLLLALCIYIRIDVIAIPVVLVFVTMDNIHEKITSLFRLSRNYSAGFVTGILIGGYVDFVNYGQWFMSPLQWLRFNVFSKTSGIIFGISPSFFYCFKLYDVEPLLIVCIGIIAISLPLEIHSKHESKSGYKNTSIRDTDFRGILTLCVLMILYSGNNHKELRFLHNTVIVLYISLSRAMYTLVKAFLRQSVNQNSQYCIYSVYLFISLFASSHIYDFCNLSQSGQSKWTYSGATDSNDVNTCLDFIRHNDDVTGILIDRPLHLTGGYSLLHKDVPLFALNKYEFMEYDEKSKLNVLQLRNGQYSEYKVKRVKVFGRISEFISIFNTPFLLKQLITKKEYNYLILRKDRAFAETGFEQVFVTGNSRVLRRTFDPESEAKMAGTAHHIPVGTNATILEYEGDWLSYFGLYSKAEQRLLFSNRLDPTRTGPFRALLGIYKRLGVTSNYQSVLDACTQVHSMVDCLQPYRPIPLHSDYYRKVSKVDDNSI